MQTIQMKQLNEEKEKCLQKGYKFCFSNPWDWMQCNEAVLSTYFPQVEFINPHQVVWLSKTEEECEFHNAGLPDKDFLSPMFYVSNLEPEKE